jgi:hypothetical protein
MMAKEIYIRCEFVQDSFTFRAKDTGGAWTFW